MVTLNLIVEGGVYTDNASAMTALNVESLRQSLHSFFSRVLNRDDVSIKLFLGAGYRQAAKNFIESSEKTFLYVDSDQPADSLNRWFESLINQEHPEKTIIIPEEKLPFVFFMIQEMEAWFLKQPECLEHWAEVEGYNRVDPQSAIESHSLIRNKNIEDISKPSEKLSILMKKFFKKGKKAAHYGKLRTAPALLDALATATLLPKDAQLQRFYATVHSQIR